MEAIEKENVACDLCRVSNSVTLFNGRDYRYGHKEMFAFVKCISCGLTFLNPRPTMDSVMHLYEEDYSVDNEQIVPPVRDKGGWMTALKKAGRRFIGSYTDEIIESAEGRVLDVGCGSGYLLMSLRRKGREVYGVEANGNAVHVCRGSGLDVFHGSLEEARYPDEHFDTVILSQVIEHVQSPRRTLKEISRILKPGGRVLVYCPNVDSYLIKVFGRYWHGWHIPFHFYGFDSETIGNAAGKNGLMVSRAGTVTPARFLLESVKGLLWGEEGYCNTRYAKKIMRIMGPLIILSASPALRIIDRLYPEKGDCLKIEIRKKRDD